MKPKDGIYNKKFLFSIFGIGDYSFKPYKVAISGFYKTFHFTLVLPNNNKPLMFDDTCYKFVSIKPNGLALGMNTNNLPTDLIMLF